MAGLRNSLHLILNVLGLLFLLGVLAALVYRYNVRIDLTPEKRYTLSKHSQKVLDGITQDVEVLAFTRREDPRNRFLEDILWRVSTYNPKVHSRIIDLNRNPALARRYKAEAYGAIVVESQGRRKSFSSVKEEVLIGALLGVTRNYQKTVYFLTGHGERDLFDSDRYRGYSTARLSLEEELYRVQPLSLLEADEVPSDATVVVLAAPKRDLLPAETLRLGRYLKRGGAMLVMVDPDSSPSVTSFLARYGVRLPEEAVADGDQRLASSEALTMKVPDVAQDSLVTATLDADPVFSLSRPVAIDAEAGAVIEARPLLSTSASSWAIRAPGGVLPPNLEFHEGRDRRGPFALGQEIRIPVETETLPATGEAVAEEIPPRSTRLVVYGDSDFANNFFIEILGNRDLLINTVNWLSLEESLIGVRPVRKEVGREQFFVSNRQSYVAFWLGTILQPGLFLVLGIAVFLWRRLR